MKTKRILIILITAMTLRRKQYAVIFLLLGLTAGVSSSAYSQIGWTLSQMEGKYGKSIKVRNQYRVWLQPTKFPRICESGYNAVLFSLFQDKVVAMELKWFPNVTFDTLPHKANIPAAAIKKADENFRAKLTAENQSNFGKVMSYPDAKQYALSYVDASPDIRAVRHEQTHTSDDLANEVQTTGKFDYNGWHFDYYCATYSNGSVNQSFAIQPAPDNPIAKAYSTFLAQQSANERSQLQRLGDAELKRETR